MQTSVSMAAKWSTLPVPVMQFSPKALAEAVTPVNLATTRADYTPALKSGKSWEVQFQ
jgi:hypothetical protein